MPAKKDSPQLHTQLLALLPAARAESCQVVATFLDIRGFSTFAAKGESFDSAVYLRSVYSTILSTYFSDADYFKLTGDGLLLVHELPDDAQQVPRVVSSILGRCVDLVESFDPITAEDYMVIFPVPQRLGAGVARGSATRLVSGALVLDYSGRCLNLAARLLDKARPYGVVFSDSHAHKLMQAELALMFASDRVCIRGIAVQEPIPVAITRSVEIHPADREPLTQSKRTYGSPTDLSVGELHELSNYGFYLLRAPHSYEIACVDVEIPRFDKTGKRLQTVTTLMIRGQVEEQPDGWLVHIQLKRVKESVKNVPAATTSKVFAITKKTTVTFTPYCRPKDES